MKDKHCRNTKGNRGIGTGKNPSRTSSNTSYGVGLPMKPKTNDKGVVSQGSGGSTKGTRGGGAKKMSY